ncbi:pyridoxamine 5'-phosphate oxidase family protein [Streptomyces atratus]|uniref:pyridoxamine 5'-phosphate oxidase family protein n=1 Tax=Streptomyces atratus TaxID=1893 RepID=UPI00340B9F8D
MTDLVARRMVEVSGTEALWLLESSDRGRLVHPPREVAVVSPAVHVLPYGRLIVRTPLEEAALSGRTSPANRADEIRGAGGTGRAVTAGGPAQVVTDPDEAAHHPHTLQGWVRCPHDTLVGIHPQTVSGFRPALTEAR